MSLWLPRPAGKCGISAQFKVSTGRLNSPAGQTDDRCLWVQVAVPLAVGLSLLLAGQAVPGMVMFGMAGLAAFVFWLWRAEIGLASRLLGVSAHGLVANPHLITLTVVLNVLGLLSTLPLLVFSGEEA